MDQIVYADAKALAHRADFLIYNEAGSIKELITKLAAIDEEDLVARKRWAYTIVTAGLLSCLRLYTQLSSHYASVHSATLPERHRLALVMLLRVIKDLIPEEYAQEILDQKLSDFQLVNYLKVMTETWGAMGLLPGVTAKQAREIYNGFKDEV